LTNLLLQSILLREETGHWWTVGSQALFLLCEPKVVFALDIG
jgi:hypothetical protein